MKKIRSSFYIKAQSIELTQTTYKINETHFRIGILEIITSNNNRLMSLSSTNVKIVKNTFNSYLDCISYEVFPMITFILAIFLHPFFLKFWLKYY